MNIHTIHTEAGRVLEGRAALAAAFQALPDGEHLVRIVQAGSAAGEIEKIVGWYSGLDELQMNDPGLLLYLNPYAANLVILLADFSAEVTSLRQEREAAKFRVETEINTLVNADRQGEGKFSQVASALAASVACKDLLQKKMEAEQAHHAAAALLDAWRDIYERMRSQIAYLRGLNGGA